METLHEYFNLISGLLDLVIAAAVLATSRKLTGATPKVVWILAGFFLVSGLGYLNEPSPLFGTHPTLAVVFDVARLIALVLVAAIMPGVIRSVSETLRSAKYQTDERRQAMLDRYHEM